MIEGRAVSGERRDVILIEPAADGGYGAWVPDVPGRVALGDTCAQAVMEMRSAETAGADSRHVRLHFAILQQRCGKFVGVSRASGRFALRSVR